MSNFLDSRFIFTNVKVLSEAEIEQLLERSRVNPYYKPIPDYMRKNCSQLISPGLFYPFVHSSHGRLCARNTIHSSSIQLLRTIRREPKLVDSTRSGGVIYNQTTYELRALNKGVEYHFAIEAFNENGISAIKGQKMKHPCRRVPLLKNLMWFMPMD